MLETYIKEYLKEVLDRLDKSDCSSLERRGLLKKRTYYLNMLDSIEATRYKKGDV